MIGQNLLRRFLVLVVLVQRSLQSPILESALTNRQADFKTSEDAGLAPLLVRNTKQHLDSAKLIARQSPSDDPKCAVAGHASVSFQAHSFQKSTENNSGICGLACYYTEGCQSFAYTPREVQQWDNCEKFNVPFDEQADFVVRDAESQAAFSDLRASDGGLYCLGAYAGWPSGA